MLVVGNAYDAVRVLFSAGDRISILLTSTPLLSYTLWSLHMTPSECCSAQEIGYLFFWLARHYFQYTLWSLHTSAHSSVNVLMTSCKPHLNWTVLEVDYHFEVNCAGTVCQHSSVSSLLAQFGCVHAIGKNCSSRASEHVSSRASESQSLLSRLNWASVHK